MKFGSIIICKDAHTGGVRDAVDYLSRAYGISEDHIVGLHTEATAGKPVLITVTVHRRVLHHGDHAAARAADRLADEQPDVYEEDLVACPADAADLGPCILYRGHAEAHSWRGAVAGAPGISAVTTLSSCNE